MGFDDLREAGMGNPLFPLASSTIPVEAITFDSRFPAGGALKF
jgi:hypothetical protein